MASFWDLLPAGAWQTQPFVPPYDPMQMPWAVDTTQASPSRRDLQVPWERAPLFSPYPTSQYGASAQTPPGSYSAPDIDDPARYRRMADDAKRTYDVAMWAFGPPSVPQAPAMRDPAAGPYRVPVQNVADMVGTAADMVGSAPSSIPTHAATINRSAATANFNSPESDFPPSMSMVTMAVSPAKSGTSSANGDRGLSSSGRTGFLSSLYEQPVHSDVSSSLASSVDPWLSPPREFQQVVHPLYPNPPNPPPHEDIPGGPWTWRPDAADRRGGKWKGRGTYSGDWDPKDGHWDIDDGNGHRQRYNRHGAPISENEAHGPYRGPRRIPFPRWPRVPGPFPFIILPNPCHLIPDFPGCPDPNST